MTQKRIYRYPINLTRELRLIESGMDASAAPSAPIPIIGNNDLDLDAPVPVPASAAAASAPFVTFAKPGAAPPAAPAAPTAKTQVASGRILDRYSRASELGRGAMGVVQRAWDENLERDVAIKVMADDLQKNPEAMRLFQQEAKALAQLNHTNIVGVYDQVTRDNTTYMIMEFVDGTTLEAMLDQLPDGATLPLPRVIEIVDQVCAGLAYAHARRVIHRDVKPANVFIARDGTVKLGDFGLARVTRELTIHRTEIRGTPLYMAPEQITGADLDHRVDLYAVGCTMFELATGRPPFVDGDILYHQLHTPAPRARAIHGDVSEELDEIIANLLAKSANDRPASAGDVRVALARLKK
jgi:serine/threonine-protein kinase